MESLVIVESGAKATKIKGYLEANFKDEGWQVAACLGHIRDLPDNENAVNPSDWTDLKWEGTPKGKKTIKELRNKYTYCFKSLQGYRPIMTTNIIKNTWYFC